MENNFKTFSKINMNWTSTFYLVVILFLAVFMPPLVSIPMSYIVVSIMTVYILYTILTSCKTTVKLDILKITYGFWPFLIYVFLNILLRVLLNESSFQADAYLANGKNTFLPVVYSIVLFIFLMCFFYNNKSFSLNDYVTVLILVAMAEVLTVFLSYANETIQSFFHGFVLKNGLNEITTDNIGKFSYRAFGLTGYFLDNFSFIMSGLSVLAFAKALFFKKKLLFLCSLFMVFASVLAARTGIILSLVGFLLVFRFYPIKFSLKNCIISTLTLLACLVALIYFYENFSPERKAVIEQGIKATISLLTFDSVEGVYSQILFADLVFPDDIWFGIGAKPETLGYYDLFGAFIDNGYIQTIWRFGLIGLILLFVGYVKFYYAIYKSTKSRYSRSLIIAFSFMLILYFVKYYPVPVNGSHIIYLVTPAVFYYFNVSQKGIKGNNIMEP